MLSLLVVVTPGLLLSPWLLYEHGLGQIGNMPLRPTQIAPPEQLAWVCQHARGAGPLRVEPTGPYDYVWEIFRLGMPTQPAGER